MPLNVKQIYEGWRNYFIKNPVVEKEAERRAELCGKCKLSGTVLGKDICTECGCPIAFKTRSMDAECPHPKGKKW